MEKIEYNGEIYYYYNKKFVDSCFLEVDKTISQELFKIHFSNVDYKNLNDEELLDLIKKYKTLEFFGSCAKMCEHGLLFAKQKSTKKTILPILSSCYRQSGTPEKCIELFKKYNSSEFLSVPFVTSVASSFCNLGDFSTAKKYANFAYAMQGTNKSDELSLVYKRIKLNEK